jgi:hypothetical protein
LNEFHPSQIPAAKSRKFIAGNFVIPKRGIINPVTIVASIQMKVILAN